MNGARAYVFVENEFWAGLTDHQPVVLLEALRDGGSDGAILRSVAPAERVPSLRGELERRLDAALIARNPVQLPPGIEHAVRTSLGPVLALATSHQVPGAIQLELAADPSALANLEQLRAVCTIADRETFRPLGSEFVTEKEG